MSGTSTLLDVPKFLAVRANWRRCLILTVTVLGATPISGACGPPPPGVRRAPPSDPAPPQARVTVDVRFTARDRLDVTLRLPKRLLGDARLVQLPFYAEKFRRAKGYAHFVVHKNKPWDDPEYQRPSGTLTLRYQVRLEHHRAQPTYGLDQVPHPAKGGWFLVGRAFIPWIKIDGRLADLPARVRFHPPPGSAVAASVGTPQRLTREGTLRQIIDAIYFVGRFARVEIRQGGARVTLVSSDYSSQELAPLRKLVTQTLKVGTRVLGRLSSGRRLVVYHRAPRGFAGGVVGQGVSVLSSTPPTASALSPQGTLVVHELMHLWSSADQMWLSEGLTDYLRLLLSLRLDRASEAVALTHLMRHYHRYLARRPKGVALGTGRGAWVYDAGLLLAFCLDVRLRRHRSTIFQVFRNARRDRRAGPPVTAARFKDRISAASKPARAQLDQMLTARSALDFPRCLTEAGYRTRSVTYRGYSLRTLVLDVLRITSFSPQWTEIFKVRTGSLFRPGDVLLDVGGTPVAQIHEIDWAIHRLGKVNAVWVTLLRSGNRLRLRLPLRVTSATGGRKKTQLVVTPGPSTAGSPLRAAPKPRPKQP